MSVCQNHSMPKLNQDSVPCVILYQFHDKIPSLKYHFYEKILSNYANINRCGTVYSQMVSIPSLYMQEKTLNLMTTPKYIVNRWSHNSQVQTLSNWQIYLYADNAGLQPHRLTQPQEISPYPNDIH